MPLKSIDGLPVIDAKRPLILHITEDDIKYASRKEPSMCAAAIACRRELHAEEARIHLGRVYLKTTKGNWTRYVTPKPLRTEVITFDRGGKFAPGEFVLLAPSPSKKMGADTRVRPGKKKRVYPSKRRPATIVQDVRNGPA